MNDEWPPRYGRFTRTQPVDRPRPLSLSDAELATVMQVCRAIDPEKRAALLERLVAALEHRRGDVAHALNLALRGLVQGGQGADDAA
jgi:hypothetical protein